MTNPLLLMAFAYSTKIKSDRQKARAIAAEKEKSKITNYVFGKDGIRAIAPNENARKGEKLYGFTVGNSGTINKFPEAELPLIDLYENPLDPSKKLITLGQYNALNTGYTSIDQADSTTTTKPPLGRVVAQRSPADNKLIYMEGYKPFDLSEVTETVFVRLVNNRPVEVTGNQKATHTITVKKKNNKIVSTSAPEIIKKDKQTTKTVEEGIRDENNRFTTVIPEGGKATHERVIEKVNGNIVSTGTATLIREKEKEEILTEYEYYDDKGKVTTNPTEIVSQRPFKLIDGVKKFVGKIEEYKPKEGEKTKITFLYDKDGEETTDKSQAVQQQTKTFDSAGGLLEEGDLKDVKKFEPKEKDTNLSKTEYLVREINNPRIEKYVARDEALKLQSDGTHNIIGYVNYNEKGVAGKLEPYNLKEKKDAVDKAKRSKDIVLSIPFPTEEKDNNFKTIYQSFPFYRNQAGKDNLAAFNDFLLTNPQYVELINKDPILNNRVISALQSNVNTFFLRPLANSKGDVIFTDTLPKTPPRARTLIAGNFKELVKLKGFKDMVLIAADLADEKYIQSLTENKTEGNTNLPVKYSVNDNEGNSLGTAYAKVELPDVYDDTLKELSTVIASAKLNKNDVGSFIERLLVYETDEFGKIVKKPSPAGDRSINVVAKSQPILDFVEQLRKTNYGDLKIKGRQATELDAFLSMIHPHPSEHPIGEINLQIQNSIEKRFASLMNNNFEKSMNLISAFTSRNSSATNTLLQTFYGDDYSERKVREEIRGKVTSAYNGMTTVDAMIDTYFMEDGEFIDVNTRQAELGLKGIGFLKTGEKIIRAIGGGKIINLITTEPDEVADTLYDQSLSYDMTGGGEGSRASFNGKILEDDDPKEAAARERNKQRLADIKRAIKTGGITGLVDKLPRKLQAQLRGSKGTEIVRKLAVRQYHKYMLAYQLAAAIQGGTGGRTISDQDVENIMRSLNFGLFTPAVTEVVTLSAARKMLKDIHDYNNALLDPNPSKQFAALKSRQFLQGQERIALLNTVKSRRDYITKKLTSIDPRIKGVTGGGSINVNTEKQQMLEKFVK